MVMTTTGFCSWPERAGPSTSGWRTLFMRLVPRGVRPENLTCCRSCMACCSFVMLLPCTFEFMKRTWMPSWSNSEVAYATRLRMLDVS